MPRSGSPANSASFSAYDLAAEIDRALGTAWDEDLEIYRYGTETGAEVTWLRRDVG
ncbi:DUF3145 family protein [Nocardia gamkensis]|uniref:DUF3145 family protein n=1 Tax=Nocardia gamkensis TaxID=352869 RepID=A0A7X6R303_9NOCA|nr:DUF3145 family protein [Nocardia gamkensis]NQE68361.1 hypothetical protein [Nocardia gamkensis]